MELSVLIFVIVIALFVRFAVAVIKSGSRSSSDEQKARVRQAIQMMRTRPPAPPSMPVPPVPAPVAMPEPMPTTYALPEQPPAPVDVDDDPPVTGILNGPRLVTLTPDQQRRVLEYMDQGYEVMAVRLVCDETRAGILDAQKTVRTLAGLPSPY